MNTSILLAAQQQGGGMGTFLIMMIAIFVIMWFFMIRPQQKRQKEIRKFQNSLQEGTNVVTGGGIYGVVRKIDLATNIVDIEISKGVVIRVDKNYVFADVASNMGAANAQAKLARIHCTDEATKKYDSTTGESMKAADEANQCMTNLIIKELGKGFAIEYQDDLYNDIFYLQQMVTKLNADYYYLNAYCKDNCGTLGNQLWRGNLLDANEKILAQLIFLNTNQNPY